MLVLRFLHSWLPKTTFGFLLSKPECNNQSLRVKRFGPHWGLESVGPIGVFVREDELAIF
jgi:hypothetical protein